MATVTTAAAFATALRSFRAGTLSRHDFLEQLRDRLAAGVSAGELVALLHLRESIDALGPAVHQAAVGLLLHAPNAQPRDSADDKVSAADGPIPPEEPTVVLEEAWHDAGLEAAPDELPPPALAGETLAGRYYLIELIGEGGMSRVYRAVDIEGAADDPYVAVKVLTRTGDEHATSLSRLQAQFDRLRDFVHPNIVRLIDCGRQGEIVFIVMEYVAGQSLYTRLQAAEVPSDPISIVRSIGDALIYAHEHAIVHGDLKPGNVMITDGENVKVIDFALSTWMARPAVTPRYASPQQMARQKPEPSDDLFALGCLSYELLTGRQPFVGVNGERSFKFPPAMAGLSPNQYLAISNALKLERRDRTPTVRQFIQEFTGSTRQPPRRSAAIWAGSVALIIALAGYYAYRERRAELAPAPLTRDTSVSPPATKQDAAGSRLLDCTDCPPLTVLPKGQFDQGFASSASLHEKPQHRVIIGYEVAVAVNDVTVDNFSRFIAATGRNMAGCDIYDGEWRHKSTADWREPGFTQGPGHPVVCVSWNDAVAYAQWLSTVTGHHYRLPSAAEWEYAARGGSAQDIPWGTDGQRACAQANVADQSAAERYPGWQVFACNDHFVNTSPVGSFSANPFGLNDTLGNVLQWTQDCWHTDYAGAPTDGSARDEERCSDRELRGGSWFSSPNYVRTSYRNHFASDYRTSSVGFRVVRDLDP
jgi:formylglycine-generating enzyme required for sulfatase activity